MFNNILLAIDGSDHALEAVRVAGEMARYNDADLRVVVAYVMRCLHFWGSQNFSRRCRLV